MDASMIALFAQQKELPEQTRIKIPKKNEELLKALVRRKNDLTGMLVREKTRLAHPQVVFCQDNCLLKQRPDGTFEDVTAKAGLLG